ncbi:polysaccharide pyruvyl transferase family protein [Myroides odoratimimus]|uniref:polysaccharide pyruvyl transferase family protein n=1 Tax=Myroides odoratimimus TaxID=76832 RepID=UPI002DB7D07D|nr:polysaccharide pyruvyl transferase family protein [Myroides odoratimimus]MEC4028766.1 polysaccharide pyruvyl transferase family protein [Myroides odoratimimus]
MEFKKVLLKIYPELNFGDDLFLKIILEKYSNTTFYLLCEKKKYQKIQLEYSNLILIDNSEYLTIYDRVLYRISNLISVNFIKRIAYNRLLNKQYNLSLNEYDIFLLVGGSMFMELDGSGQRLLWYYQWINNTFLNKPKFYLGCNFGPYKKESFIDSFREIFKSAEQLSFRENYSQDLFKNLSNTDVAPDIVFGLDFKQKEVEKKGVGLVLVDPRIKYNKTLDYEKYILKVVALVTALSEKEDDIIFFSFCKKEMDEELYEDIKIKLPENVHKNVKVVSYNGNIEEFLNEYSRLEYCFCSRFHGIILSLLFGHKLLPISYSAKIENMLFEIGYNGKVIKLDEFDSLSVREIQESTITFTVSDEIKELSKLHFKRLNKFLS